MSLKETIKPTTLIPLPKYAAKLGLKSLVLISEVNQLTHSFKFRAAYNVCLNIKNNSVIAASSGNFGQALALAAKMTNKRCHIIMPSTSALCKVKAVRSHGATVVFVDTTKGESRAQGVKNTIKQQTLKYPNEQPPYHASAFDSDYVIQGNSTLGDEIHDMDLDYVLVPIGGGGLSSGIILSFLKHKSSIKVIGVEPQLANDASQSFKAGKLIGFKTEVQTIADGARTLRLGQRNWEIIRDNIKDILEVDEAHIRSGLRTIAAETKDNHRVEPTGALSVGALQAYTNMFKGKRVGCVLSGGNVDDSVYDSIMKGTD